MANVSKIKLPDNTTVDIKDARVVSDAIVYQGDDMGDATYTDSGTVVDISDYASKTWVENKSYARAIGTSGEFIKGDGSLDSACYDPYIVGTQTAATNLWTGVAPFATLQTGQSIRYKLPVAGNSTAATLNLTLSDGATTTGAIAVVKNASTGITTHYAAGSMLYLTYDGTKWIHDAEYDTNTTYNLSWYYPRLPIKGTLGRYRLVFTSADKTHLIPANISTSTSATAKKDTTQVPIDPFGSIYYYNSTTAKYNEERPGDNTLYTQLNGVTLGYSFNRTGVALSMALYKPVFLKCAPQPDGSATIDFDNPFVQDLPTYEDGKIYIRLGIAYGATTITLDDNKPVYCFKDGAVRQWSNSNNASAIYDNVLTSRRGETGNAVATVEKIKGKSVVWNQITETHKATTCTVTVSNGIGHVVSTNNSNRLVFKAGSPYQGTNTDYTVITKDHVYLQSAVVKSDGTHEIKYTNYGGGLAGMPTVSTAANTFTRIAAIAKASASTSTLIQLYSVSGTAYDFIVSSLNLFDLTLMFGSGNEPATVEEFERMFPLSYYDYVSTPGIISCWCDSIQSTGFNQWDEEWEAGTYDSQNGNKLNDQVYAAGKIRNKNYIRVLPNTTYYVNNTNFMYWEYDINKGYIEYSSSTGKTPTNGLFTTGPNCYFINFRVTGTTYNNDICLNFSNSAKNGTYEPYKLSQSWGTEGSTLADGLGDLNGLFEDYGLCSAGSVYDEVTPTKAIKRIGIVDLGSLTWNALSNYFYTDSLIGTIKERAENIGVDNILCEKYITTPDSYINIVHATCDKEMCVIWTSSTQHGRIYIRDSAYSDATTFKASLNGVHLYFELATPEEATYSKKDWTYNVWDGGTEYSFLGDGSVPLLAEIKYRNEYTAFEVDEKLGVIDDKIRIDADLYAERKVSNNSITNTLYIRAKYGVMNPGTDNLIFIRHVAVRDYKNHGVKNQRRKGWIRPHYYNDILLNFKFDHIDSRSGLAYYRVFPGIKQYANSRFVQDYLSPDGTIHWYNSFKELRDDQNAFKQDHIGSGDGGFGPARLDKKCAMYVERNGKRISDYLRFSVHGQGSDIGIRVT